MATKKDFEQTKDVKLVYTPNQGMSTVNAISDGGNQISQSAANGGSDDATRNAYFNGLTEDGVANPFNLNSASAKELLDSNIQMANARQQSAKMLNTQMSNMGLGNTGYAGTMATGIQNAYLNGLSNNQSAYIANQIANNEQSANNDFSMVLEALGSSDPYSLDKALALGDITASSDKNGNVIFGGAGYDKLSDSQKRQLSYYYDLYGGNSGMTMDRIKQTTSSNNANDKNETYDLGAKYASLFDELASGKHDGELDGNGTLIRLHNGGDGNNATDYIFYYKGKYYPATESQINSWSGSMLTLNH